LRTPKAKNLDALSPQCNSAKDQARGKKGPSRRGGLKKRILGKEREIPKNNSARAESQGGCYNGENADRKRKKKSSTAKEKGGHEERSTASNWKIRTSAKNSQEENSLGADSVEKISRLRRKTKAFGEGVSTEDGGRSARPYSTRKEKTHNNVGGEFTSRGSLRGSRNGLGVP